MKEMNINKIFQNFHLKYTLNMAVPFGSGHIHDTYLIKTKEDNRRDYVLQKINNSIFQNVEGLMNNIQKVTHHIKEKILKYKEVYGSLETLEVIPTRTGSLFYIDEQNNYWRLFNHIPNSISYDRITSSNQAFQEGKAFGQFQSLLQDLSPDELVEIIPDFHNVEKRLETFQNVVKQDPFKRAGNFSEEIDFIKSRAKEMSYINSLYRKGNITKRITHNDTKLNNVLFNEKGKPLCVIDLDTVMPGFVAYDFGDSIRTTINTANEDEEDISKISIDMNLFEAYTKGFLSETKEFLKLEEKATLAFGAKLLTYLMGLRFFTDYLNGDKYFKIQFIHHNLQRARAQFQLLRKMEEKYVEMQNVIERIWKMNEKE